MIFISYSRRDGHPYASQLETHLHERKFATWRDVRDLHPDRDFTADIEKAIEGASHVVVCVTPDTKRDDSFVRREIQYALAVNKPVIPFRCAEIVPHVSIINNEWVDHFQDSERAFRRLVEIVGGAAYDNQPDDTDADPFRPYLQALYQSIVNGLAQRIIVPIDLYVEPTPDAVERPKITPKINLIEQAFSGVTMRQTSEPEPEKRDFKTFSEGFEAYDGRVLLLGEPGAGKTITLMAYARDAISARLDDVRKPLPLFGLVPTWDAEQQTPLHEWLAAPYELDAGAVKNVIEAGRALLLLDGLDELGGERENTTSPPTPLHFVERGESQKTTFDPRLRFLGILPAKNRILLTSRVEEYGEIGQKAALNGAITLQSLNDAQMEMYLREQPHLWALIQQDEQLREVARTPLLMSVFAFAYRDLTEEEQAQLTALRDARDLRDKIFLRYIEQRYRHEEAKVNANLRVTLDALKAYLGHLAIDDIAWSLKATNVFSLKGIDASTRPLVDLAERLRLIARSDLQTFRFVHLLLLETMAYDFACDALSEVDQSLRMSAVRTLGYLNDPRALDSLIFALKDSDAPIRTVAAVILADMKSPQILDAFIDALSDDDWYVRSIAAQALGNLGDPKAMIPLYKSLSDSYSDVRNNALTALRRFGNWKAQMLIQEHYTRRFIERMWPRRKQ